MIQFLLTQIAKLKTSLSTVNNSVSGLSDQVTAIECPQRANVSVLTYAKNLSEGIHFYTTSGGTEGNPASGSHAFIIFCAATGVTILGMTLASRDLYVNASNNSGESYSGWKTVAYQS